MTVSFYIYFAVIYSSYLIQSVLDFIKEKENNMITVDENYLKMFLTEKDLNPVVIYRCLSENPKRDVVYLKEFERYFTSLLYMDGFLFLNDVFYHMGLPKTKAGQITGWLYDPEEKEGSSRVSFGLTDDIYEKIALGILESVPLRFNIDGEILSKVVFPYSGDEI